VRLEISEQELVFTSVGSRTAMRWSAFSQCLESPALFVLLNNSRTVLWPVPKRAFPDEKSMSWFRTLANQPLGIATAPASEVSAPGRSAARGIALTVQLGYRDHLVRMLTSWRTRGILLVLLAILTGASLFSFVNPPPDAVVPPGKVFRMMMETMIPMLAAVLFLVSFIAWRSEKKHLRPPQVALTSEGIEFADRDNGGLLALSLPRSFRAG
jgi:hypothetical protein